MRKPFSVSLQLALLIAGCGGLWSGTERPFGADPLSPETPAPNDSGETPVDSGDPNSAGADGGFIVQLPDGGADTPVKPSTDAGADPLPSKAFTWARMTPTNARPIVDVGGRGEGASLELFVLTDNALLRYFDKTWTTVLNDNTGVNYTSLWVSPAGPVFVGGGRLVSCLSGCTQESAFKLHSTYGSAVCGDGPRVFAVNENPAREVSLYRFNFPPGEGWTRVVADVGAHFAGRCWVSPQGEAFVAAQSSIFRFDGEVIAAERVDYPSTWTTSEVANQMWQGVSGHGTDIYAVGTRRRVLQRGATGVWSLVFNPSGVNDLQTVTVLGPGDVLAAGRASSDGQTMVQRTDAWGFVRDAPTVHALGSWAVSNREVYVGGYHTTGIQGALWRGVR
ncbi:MAG: hypothetical protein ACT4TC_13175 [Myxococcaceae bacterium]